MNAVLLPEQSKVAPTISISPSPKTRPKLAKAITQAIRLQAIVYGAVSDELEPRDIAGLARAWCDLNEERRKLAMQPLPRPIDTTKFGRRSRARSSSQAAPAEPVEPSTPQPVVKPADS